MLQEKCSIHGVGRSSGHRDACCGVSMEFGRAMGNDEPVTPVFPNSDFCTGTSGVAAVLNAILRRGAEGGSYQVDVSCVMIEQLHIALTNIARSRSTITHSGSSTVWAYTRKMSGNTYGLETASKSSDTTTAWVIRFHVFCRC